MTDLEQRLRVDGAPPEHAPGFADRLWAAIAADERMDANRFRDADRLDTENGGDDRPAGGRTAAAVVVPHARRRTRLLALLAAAAVVAAVAVGIAVKRQAIPELSRPPIASAAEVAARVRTAMSEIRTLQVTETEYQRSVQGPPKSQWQANWTTADWWSRARMGALHSTGRLKIIAEADGRWHEDDTVGTSRQGPIVYPYSGDDVSGVLRTYWPPDSPVYVTRNLSLGAPDQPVVYYGPDSIWYDISFMRPANMAQGHVAETTYEGLPALTVTCPIAPVPIKGLEMGTEHLFDTVQFTVDRRTWLIVCGSRLLRGAVVEESRLTHIHVNQPVAGDAMRLTYPAGTRIKTVSLQFRHVSFGEAARTFAQPALAPSALPAGFRPFAAAVAATSHFTHWTPVGYRPDYWPAAHNVTQLNYRAGLLQFTVTTRTQPAGGSLPADPLDADPFLTSNAVDDDAATGTLETVTLTGGAWSGVTAYLVMPLLAQPHLWAWHDGRLVTVGGDLTRDELLSVANSLQPMK